MWNAATLILYSFGDVPEVAYIMSLSPPTKFNQFNFQVDLSTIEFNVKIKIGLIFESNVVGFFRFLWCTQRSS